MVGMGNIQSSVTIRSEPVIDSISPLIGSIYGGSRLIIRGNGFSKTLSDLQVMIDANPCAMINATHAELQCLIPPQETSSALSPISVSSAGITFSPEFYLNYSVAITPLITVVMINQINASLQFTITGSNFVPARTTVRVGKSSCPVISVSSTTVVCTMSNNISAGYHSIVAHVESVGNSNANFTYRRDLQINGSSPNQGSFGGGLPVTIIGDGFAGDNASATVCDQPCLSIEVLSNTRMVCVTPAMTPTAIQSCNLTVTVDQIRSSTTFTYRMNLTSTIASISPTRGGTGGNTTVTIVGTNFM